MVEQHLNGGISYLQSIYGQLLRQDLDVVLESTEFYNGPKNMSSGMSMCGGNQGFAPSPCQCGAESYSGGTSPQPVPGNVTIYRVNCPLS